MSEISVASFNAHAGVDGWGRPFDLSRALAAIDADIVVVEEAWASQEGEALARGLGASLGYQVVEASMGHGFLRLASLPLGVEGGPATWGPGGRPGRPGRVRSLRLERPMASTRRAPFADDSTLGAMPAGPRRLEVRGSLGLAVLSRLPVREHCVVDLARLPRDPARRVAIVLSVETDAGLLEVTGTHLGHLSHGSPLQMRELASLLAPRTGPGVLLGDFNCWGPPLVAAMRGWRRAVKGRTWPAWRPHSQVDHVLVRNGVEVLSGEVLGDLGSDHRPVRARITW